MNGSAVMAVLLILLPGTGHVSARGIARALEHHYHHVDTMEAVFLETYRSGTGNIVAESGKVYFSRPGRMRWDYSSPERKLFLVDGKDVWYYVPEDHTASRTSIRKSADWRTPLALLAGKANIERLCGSVRLANPLGPTDPEERPSLPGNRVLVCWPRKEDRKAFREVLFEVNARNQLVRVTIRQPGNVETEFRFGDWKENIPIPEAEFHFEPPMGVAIVNDEALARKVQ